LTVTKVITDCEHKNDVPCGPAVGATATGCTAVTNLASRCFGVTDCDNTTPELGAVPGPGDIVTYQVTVSNNKFNAGCTTAHAVTVTDSLPGAMTFIKCVGATCIPTSGGIQVSVGDLVVPPAVGPAISTQTFTLQAQVTPGTANLMPLSNVVTARASNGGTGTYTASTFVGAPVLNVVKLNSPSPVEPGGTISYNVVLSNSGLNCSKVASLLDTLPTNADFVDGSLTLDGNCTNGPVPNTVFAADDSKFIVQNIDLPGGQVCTGRYKVTVPNGTQITTPQQPVNVVNKLTATDSFGNTASVTATDPVNTRILTLTKVISGCALNSVPCSTSNPPAGAILDYTITVGSGPYDATGVVITDSLPPPSVASFSSTTCPSYNLQGTQLTCNLGNIPPSSTGAISVKVKLNSTNPTGTIVTNMASVTDDAMDQLGDGGSGDPTPVVSASPSPTPPPTNPPGRTPKPRRTRRTPKPRPTRKART